MIILIIKIKLLFKKKINTNNYFYNKKIILHKIKLWAENL